MKRFDYEQKPQVYMYAFIYVDTETMAEEYYFTATKTFVETTIKCQFQDQSQNICLYLVTCVQKIMN